MFSSLWGSKLIHHAKKSDPRRRKLASTRRLVAEPLETRNLLAVITVDSISDVTADDGQITLREAIAASNNDTLADAQEGQQSGQHVYTRIQPFCAPPNPRIDVDKAERA